MAQTPEFYTEQAQFLNGNLVANPNLPASGVPALNKQLKTIQKDSLIKAVNELKQNLDTALNSAQNGTVDLMSVIGNFVDDPTLLAHMIDNVGPNILASIYSLLLKFGDYDLSTVVDQKITEASSPKYTTVATLPGPAEAKVGKAHLYFDSVSGKNQLRVCLAVTTTSVNWGVFELGEDLNPTSASIRRNVYGFNI